MRTVARQCQLGRVDGFHRRHGIALDARHLHQAAHWVASQAQVVLQADFGGVLDLLGGTAQHLRQTGRRHGAGRTDLALAADLCARDGRIGLDQDPDGRGRQQKGNHVVVVGAALKVHEVVQHCGHHPRSAVGGRGDHAATRGVFFVHSQRIKVDPVHGGKGLRDQVRPPVARVEAPVHRGRAPLHVQPARQHAFAAQPARHAATHDGPDVQQRGVGIGVTAPGAFVVQHQLRHVQARLATQRQQALARGERVSDGDLKHPHLARARLCFVHHEAAADRVIGVLKHHAGGPVRGQTQGVGMPGQADRHQAQIALPIECDMVTTGQRQPRVELHRIHRLRHGIRVHRVGLQAHQAGHHGAVGAVADAGRRQRAVKPHFHPLHARQQALGTQGVSEQPGRSHGANRVRA